MQIIDDPRTLVIIPLFNEESTIVPVIEETRRHYAGDILVVNDGSTDSSLKQLLSVADSDLFVISHPTNLGYGKSLIDGFNFGIENNYQVVVTIDCDFQHEPACIPGFIQELGDYDVISGSRYFFDFTGNSDAPPDRLRINRLISTDINHLTNFGLTDAFCGFKAYKVDSLKRLSLSEAGYAMPIQFWIQAWAASFRIKEIPVKRIYLNLKRSFGNGLDDPDTRLAYYRTVMRREMKNVGRCITHRCASR